MSEPSSNPERQKASKVLEALGSALIIVATVMASMGMSSAMFVPFMLANLCWVAFSLVHGFRYMLALNSVLFLINLFGAARSLA